MTDVENFLRQAAALASVTPDDLLARVLHVEDGALSPHIATMDAAVRALVVRLDRGLRLRNPGLHYVVRKKFIGYRREGPMGSNLGERSQIFASVVRSTSRLDVVLPVDPDSIGSVSNARDLRGTGHHGIGDVRVSLYNDSDVERFFSDFDYWLTPGA